MNRLYRSSFRSFFFAVLSPEHTPSLYVFKICYTPEKQTLDNGEEDVEGKKKLA